MAAAPSFVDLIEATAKQKLAAAKARNNPDPTAEKPREAIFDALHMIHDTIATDGFVLVPSTPKFVRRNGDFSFEIRIQSDRNNIAGQRAAIWVHTSVYSKTLAAWRKKHPSEWIRPKAPFPIPVYSNQLGYLCDPSGWMEWNFADKAQRQSVADDLTHTIRMGAYPLFATFEGPVGGIAALTDRDWPSPEGICSFLLSRGHTELATKALQSYFDKRPAVLREFEQFRRLFADQGLPSYLTGTPHDLAAFAVATGYPWSAG